MTSWWKSAGVLGVLRVISARVTARIDDPVLIVFRELLDFLNGLLHQLGHLAHLPVMTLDRIPLPSSIPGEPHYPQALT